MSEEKDSGEYVRVGTTLFKNVRRPLMSGDFIEERRTWNYETLRQDHSKDFISQIPKYDGFCCVPEHIDYQRSIGTFMNQYEPINDCPAEGDCSLVITFLTHIFGSQLQMGLDYLQLLYMRPLVRLPILLFVSKDRNTGKTTFLNFLKAIFAGNMTFNTNEDFHSQFNSDWANKLIIGVDEALLDRREDSERIKNLSTAISYKAEAKGKDRYEIDFFAKFVLCSNNETCPIIIEQGETRYWVRKVCPIAERKVDMLAELKAQIPQFLNFLLKRELSTQQESRMWFRHDLLITEALRRIIQYNRGQLENEMLGILEDIFNVFEQDEYRFCVQDMQAMLGVRDIKTEPVKIKRVLQDSWKLKPDKVARYTSYRLAGDGTLFGEPRTGRPYSVSREFVAEKMLFCNNEE